MFKRMCIYFFTCVFVFCSFSVLEASQAPFIKGIVQDQYGVPLPGVTVRGDNGRGISTLSDSKGLFTLKGFSPARPVTLCWERRGYPPIKLNNVSLLPAGAVFVTLGYSETKVGGTVVVRLPSNSSTGYTWSGPDQGGDMLIPVGRVMEARPKVKPGREMAGAGGHELWLYRAVNKGLNVSVFNYSRSWEKNIPPSRIYVAATIVH